MIKFLGLKIKKEALLFPVLALISAFFLPITVFVAQENQDLRNQAAQSHFTFQVEPPTGTNIYFDPGTVTLTGEVPIKVMANFPNNEIAFTQVVVTFDQSKIQLASEITTTIAFSQTIEKTDMATANAQGRANIIIAANTADTPQTGIFEIANFTIIPVEGAATDPTSIEFLTNEMQIVDMLEQALPITPGNLIINFNGDGLTPFPTGDITPTTDPSVTGDPNPTEDPIPIITAWPTGVPYTKGCEDLGGQCIDITNQTCSTGNAVPAGDIYCRVGHESDPNFIWSNNVCCKTGNDPNVTISPKPGGGNGDKDGEEEEEENEDEKENGEKGEKEDKEKENEGNEKKNMPGFLRKKIGDFNEDGRVNFKDLIDWAKSIVRRRNSPEK